MFPETSIPEMSHGLRFLKFKEVLLTPSYTNLRPQPALEFRVGR